MSKKTTYPYSRVVIKMFWLGLVIGLILGANISLFLYAIILAGKERDKE